MRVNIFLCFSAYSLLTVYTNEVKISEIGSLFAISQDDIDTSADFKSGILLLRPQPVDRASALCQSLGEDIYQFSNGDHINQFHEYFSRGVKRIGRKVYPLQNISFVALNPEGDLQCWSITQFQPTIVPEACSAKVAVLCENSEDRVQAVSTSQPVNLITVDTNNRLGSISGFKDKQGFRFQGIPYAQPPVGSLRFQPPQQIQLPFSSPFQATKYGFQCVQRDFGDPKLQPSNEDCLNLNIFTPYIQDPVGEHLGSSCEGFQKLPVLFWIHGGGFFNGASSLPDYDGSNLANRGKVVFVGINYRLGIFGFYHDGKEISNLAFQDMITALSFVKENIAYFGGDSENITVKGQSAGGTSVSAFLTMPSLKGMFQQAVIQSDPAAFGYWTLEQAVKSTQETLKGLECEFDDIQCLQQIPVESLLNGQLNYQSTLFQSFNPEAVFLFRPSIDGKLIPGDFAQLLVQGSLPNKVPLMIGNTNYESEFYIPFLYPKDQPLESVLNLFFGEENASRIIGSSLYPISSDPTLTFALITTHYFWYCPTQYLVKRFNQSPLEAFSSPVFFYDVHRGLDYPRNDDSRCSQDIVCHADELIPLFGSQEILGGKKTGDDSAYSRRLMDRWIDFARFQSPNSPLFADQSYWPPYFDQVLPVTKLLDYPESPLKFNFNNEFCQLLDSFGYDFEKYLS